MTTTAAATGSTPAPKNVFARFVGIITSPKATFQSVVARPAVLGMLLLTAVVSGIFTALPMTTDVGKQAAIETQEQRMQSMGFPVSDQMHEQFEKGAGRLPYTTGLSVVFVWPIMAALFAGILFAIFNAGLGGEASFKQVFSVYVHSGAISTLSAILSGTVGFFTGRVGSVTNLGALLPMLSEKSFAAHLLGTIDIFIIWSLVVVAMGLGVLYKRRTQPIAISLLTLYAVIAVGIALFMSRGGA